MDDELAALRERVERVEQRAALALEVADRIEAGLGSSNDLADNLIMPLLLRLGGEGFRQEMLRWMERLAKQEESWIDGEGKSNRDLLRVRYWQRLLRNREPWPDFPPDGWMHGAKD